MMEWTEADSSTYRAIADVAVPRRTEMIATLVSAVPFAPDEPVRIIEIGAGEGKLAAVLLACFPRATLLALDGSESMRSAALAQTAAFSDRRTVRPFDLAALDWWDLMHDADLVVSSMCLHHLNEAKKQYVYRAIADRLTKRGALLIADLVAPAQPVLRRLAARSWDASARLQATAAGAPELFDRFVESRWNHFRFPDPGDLPSPVFHHLVWLRHAGFSAVDCFWCYAGHAVYGGFKQSDDTMGEGVPFDRALSIVEERLRGPRG